MELLDFPKYLNEHRNKVTDVKVLCALNRQIDLPSHLQNLEKSTSNIPSLVDLIGIEIGKEQYLVKGQVVVMLGPRAYEETKGIKLMLLSGSAYLRNDTNNYVELLLVYNNNITGRKTLYATKTLFKDVKDLRVACPKIMKELESSVKSDDILGDFYESIETPSDYRYCCSGCNFPEVSKANQFVFKSEEEYKRSHVGVSYIEECENKEEKAIMETQSTLGVENRSSIKELPKSYIELNKLVKKADNKIETTIIQMQDLNSSTEDERIKRVEENKLFLYNALKKNWNRVQSVGKDIMTGRAIFKSVLESLYPRKKNSYIGSTKEIDKVIDEYNGLNIWLTGEESLTDESKKNEICRDLAYMGEKLNIAVIDNILGIRGRLVATYIACEEKDLDFFDLVRKNPYYFSVVDSRLHIEDMDKLALLYKIDIQNKEVQKYRNAAYVHNYMLDSSNTIIEDNTIVDKYLVFSHIYNGFIINESNYKCLQSTGIIFPKKVLDNLSVYAIDDLDNRNFMLPQQGWKQRRINKTNKYVLPINTGESSENVLNDYLNIGLGIEQRIENQVYLMDYTYAKKEESIIKKLYELELKGDRLNLDPMKVDQCIRGFERMKALEWNMPNFKLEDRQVEAVKGLYNPIMCVTGCAGSGKTTTAEAILYALQALLGIEEESIMFCAPTGKAASRLKEIVKKPTRTIHSLFGIGEDTYGVIKEDNVKKKDEIGVLIVDEASMINVNIMYEMLSKITDKTRIIFLGDKDQLPPIGAGKPFANLLDFLPCIVLNVSKRASDSSGITRNAVRVLNSSGYNLDPLESYDDFRIIQANQDNVDKLVAGIVNYHLGRNGPKRVGDNAAARRVLQSLDVNLSPDDIQVVTPINKYNWGTRKLNEVLQNVFNPKDESRYCLKQIMDYSLVDGERVANTKEYRIGDRVIHLENMHSEPRYIQLSSNKFTLSEDTGILNGDVGKIIGFYPANELFFEDADGNIVDKDETHFSDSETVIYTAVEYTDINKEGKTYNYVIFYSGEISEIEKPEMFSKEYIVQSSELRLIDLAYALTVHKLQGSQAKLIIFVVFPVGYTTFISRNMLYSGMTRAEQGVYLVGDVIGRDSIVSKARRIEQNMYRETITDKIFS